MSLKTCFVCRTNAPLMKAGLDVIRRCPRAKVLFLGRDIAKMLKDLVAEVLEWRRNVDSAEFIVLLDAWINNIRQKYNDREDMKAYVSEAEDNYEVLSTIAERQSASSDIINKINDMFVDADEIDEKDNSIVVFASGHRSKGLEFDRVVVIRYDLMPHPGAVSPEDFDQE